MKRTVKYILCAVFTAVFLTSCGNGVSLQRYYVDNQETKNFITQDIPISMVKIDKTNFTEAEHEAFDSVERLNFLGYNVNGADIEVYKSELAKVKDILSDKKYNDLMVLSDKGNKITVKYIGTDDEADEVVVFGSSKEIGFGIVRVLGDKMSPEKIMTLVRTMQSNNVDASQIQDIMNFFK